MKAPIVEALHLDQRKLPAETFERVTARAGLVKERRERAEKAWESFGRPGRDPAPLGGVLGAMVRGNGWAPHLKVAQLRSHWDQVAGELIAQHSYVADVRDGVLYIRADSPVWATQLTYLVPQLADAIRERLDGLEVTDIRVTGPRPQGASYGRYGRKHR